MEGPSIFLAAEQLAPFIGKKALEVFGNTKKIEKERLFDKEILDIFAWGKHLVFQFEDFALRIHFMLYGSFEASVNNQKVTGDYPSKKFKARLKLIFDNGEIDLYNCSLRYLESSQAKALYDYSIDIMSPLWVNKKALEKLQNAPEDEIGDLLLDQTIFAGVGNIIKNEVLYLVKTLPAKPSKDLSVKKLKEIIKTAREFSQQFYQWRRIFVLSQHYQIYRKGTCPRCHGKISRIKTGQRKRISFFCPNCQK